MRGVVPGATAVVGPRLPGAVYRRLAATVSLVAFFVWVELVHEALDVCPALQSVAGFGAVAAAPDVADWL